MHLTFKNLFTIAWNLVKCCSPWASLSTIFKIIEKKPKVPSSTELGKNLSSRSAKLRYAIKKKDFFDFETDVLKKFNNLIEIENIGNKIWKNY